MIDNWVFILLIFLWITALFLNFKKKRAIKIYFINLTIAISYTGLFIYFFSEGRESIVNIVFNSLVLFFHSIFLIILGIKKDFSNNIK
jgi:hypothetical protein